MMKYTIILIMVILSFIPVFAEEILQISYPSGGEILEQGDSLSLTVYQTDESNLYDLSYWKPSERCWSKIQDSLILINEKVKIKLPDVTEKYLRFKLENSENSTCAISNYFEIRKSSFEKRVYDDTNLDDKFDIRIFPNPSFGSFGIETLLKIHEVKLFTIHGNELPVKLIGNTVNVLGIPSGFYILFLVTEEGIKTKKVIIL